MYFRKTYNSPIGEIIIASDKDSIVGIWVGKQKYIYDNMQEEKDLPIFNIAKDWLDGYFAGEKPSIDDLPLKVTGSNFRKLVWKILCDIPYGKVITYGDIAKQVAKEMGIPKMSAQAVGNAVGHNPISIIIPCHRVIGTNNNLVGYGGGIETKIKLLEHEGIDITKLVIPTKGTAL